MAFKRAQLHTSATFYSFKHASASFISVSYLSTTVNICLIERGDNRVNLDTAQLSKITKLVSRFFEYIDYHILEGSYLDTVPGFTPRDANPNHQVASVIAMVDSGQHLVAEKSMTDVSPHGTP